MLKLARVLLLLILFATAGCSGSGFSGGAFTVGEAADPDLSRPPPTVGSEPPKELLTRTFDVAVARRELQALPGASAARRNSAFTVILEMGPPALGEVDRALAYETNQEAILDLTRLRMLLIEMDEAARNKPAADPTALDPTSPATPPAPGGNDAPTGVASDYGLSGLPLGDGNFNPEEVDKFVYARLQLALRLRDGGDVARCIQVCEALLLLVPTTRWRREVQQVLSDARTGEQTVRHVAGTLRFTTKATTYSDRNDGSLADPLKMSLFLKNVSTRTVILDLGNGAARGQDSMLVLDIELLNEDVTGQQITTKGPVTVPITGKRIQLAPDETVTLEESLLSLASLAPSGGRPGVLSTVKLSATLRPATLIVGAQSDGTGGERVFRPITLVGADAFVLPPSFDLDGATARPRSFYSAALTNRTYDDLFLAAPMVISEQRQAVLDLLLAADLETVGLSEQRARIRSAARISGENPGQSASAWTNWWSRNRHKYTVRSR